MRARSLLTGSKGHRAVTSSEVPSAKAAVTRSGYCSPCFTVFWAGSMVRRLTLDFSGASRAAPAAIQLRSRRDSGPPLRLPLPPVRGGVAYGFQQQQGVARVVGGEAPAARLAQQPLVVGGRVGAEERQTEAVLALDGAVTGAGVAAEAAEQGDDVTAEKRLF